MEREDFPRYAWGVVSMSVDLEHEGGIGFVNATFRHQELDSVAIKFSGFAKPGLFGRQPRRARVVLQSQGFMTDRNTGPYRLEQLRVQNSKGTHGIEPPPRLGFYMEERPGLPDYERNVRRFKQGEEVSLEVEASHRDGVAVVEMKARSAYLRVPPVSLRGKGDGSEKCRVRLEGRIGDSQVLGRYRANEMFVSPPWSHRRVEFGGNGPRREPLCPPLVFEVLRKDGPPPPAKPPKGPNWGFSERGDQADPAR